MAVPLFPFGQNPLPLQFLQPRFRQFNQEVFDRLPLVGSGHLHLPHEVAGNVAEVPGSGAFWWGAYHGAEGSTVPHEASNIT